MKEIRDIIHSFELANHAGKRTALATVVQVEGSSYRRPGARMLITEDGQLTGAISGGCLEGDALRRALLAIHQQQNKLVTYDTTDEEDARFGVQLGCNGIVYILFEPIDPLDPTNPIRLLERVVERRRHSALVTLFSMNRSAVWQPGTCFLSLGEDLVHTPSVAPLKPNLWEDCRQVLADQSSAIKTYNTGAGPLSALIEFIRPPVALIIAGAGNDAMPLVGMAATMGWEITVVDGRPGHANTQRFPKANKIIVAKPERVRPQLEIDSQTAIVLMTHNYNYDLALLRQLLAEPTDCLYIGSLGPRKKLERMLDEMEREGISFGPDQQEKIFGPTGLDIGSETAEEIALAIMAEVKAVLSGKTAQPLRERKEPIHGGRLEKKQ